MIWRRIESNQPTMQFDECYFVLAVEIFCTLYLRYNYCVLLKSQERKLKSPHDTRIRAGCEMRDRLNEMMNDRGRGGA